MVSIRLFLLLGVASGQLSVTVTPWCPNSFRVQVVPSTQSQLRTPAFAAASARFTKTLEKEGLTDIPGALIDECGPGAPFTPTPSAPATNGNLKVSVDSAGELTFSNEATTAIYFRAKYALTTSNYSGFLTASLTTIAGNVNERIFGLGQGGWTGECSGCPTLPPSTQVVVPLQRNGQFVILQQRKFHVSIPFVYSTAGYGLLYHQPGYGNVSVGEFGVGGTAWISDAALGLDFWVSGLPDGAETSAAGPIYRQYADATGHAPPLREDAMIFWQSRNRYKDSAIVEAIAANYSALGLPIGVLVVDYENQKVDGDFAPNPACYPSLSNLSSIVRQTINATTMFSFWPEVKNDSSQHEFLSQAGCLSNRDLGGNVVDTTITSCRDLIWNTFLRPNYYEQGVSAMWLDETDGEGTAGCLPHGYDTSFGPAAAFTQLWVGSWISTFSRPVALLGEAPLVLTRGVWAGGQRFGVVLWSSDIQSSFEQLASMIPQGVHASLSGIPWWTTDVGGYGCNFKNDNESPYMKELIVRWYQFGLFTSIFRTHGCRLGAQEPTSPPCVNVSGSCGPNEVWSYGADTQVLLSAMIVFRANVLKPYMAELARNVSAEGVPTMRPLWYEFPSDASSYGVDTQYMLGPKYLVAPVVIQNATNRSVVFPSGASWRSVWNSSDVRVGGVTVVVDAPLDIIPVYERF